jgi:hypothetical protein
MCTHALNEVRISGLKLFVFYALRDLSFSRQYSLYLSYTGYRTVNIPICRQALQNYLFCLRSVFTFRSVSDVSLKYERDSENNKIY